MNDETVRGACKYHKKVSCQNGDMSSVEFIYSEFNIKISGSIYV